MSEPMYALKPVVFIMDWWKLMLGFALGLVLGLLIGGTQSW